MTEAELFKRLRRKQILEVCRVHLLLLDREIFRSQSKLMDEWMDYYYYN